MCSVVEKPIGCVVVPAGSGAVLVWHTGTFLARLGGCEAIYHAVPPQSLDDFRSGFHEPINSVLDSGRRLFLVRNGMSPERAIASPQPADYPLEPSSAQGACN
jgi:hypothetical protein